MGALLRIAGKDLRLLLRDRPALFWALGFPLLIALFFGVLSGGGGKRARMAIAVEDADGTPAAAAFLARLEASDALLVTRRPAEVAARDVRVGRLVAYVRLPPGFAVDHLLEVGIDPSRRAEAGYLQGLILQTWLAGRAQPPELARVAFVSVLPDEARPRSAFEVTFPSGVLWGVIGCVATFAVSLVNERSRGTWARLRVAPIARWQILAGKAVACAAACAVVVALLLGCAALFFGVRVGSVGGLIAAALCTVVCFVGIMMLLSTLGRTERAVAGAAWGVMLPLAMLGGGMIPLVAMPRWMLPVSHLSPVKWGIVALEGSIWRGFTAAELALPCAILVGVGLATFALGTLLSRALES